MLTDLQIVIKRRERSIKWKSDKSNDALAQTLTLIFGSTAFALDGETNLSYRITQNCGDIRRPYEYALYRKNP